MKTDIYVIRDAAEGHKLQKAIAMGVVLGLEWFESSHRFLEILSMEKNKSQWIIINGDYEKYMTFLILHLVPVWV